MSLLSQNAAEKGRVQTFGGTDTALNLAHRYPVLGGTAEEGGTAGDGAVNFAGIDRAEGRVAEEQDRHLHLSQTW